MEQDELIKLAKEFEERARNTTHDYTRVKWLYHQARNCRRMAAGLPEPQVDSHHTQFHLVDHKDPANSRPR